MAILYYPSCNCLVDSTQANTASTSGGVKCSSRYSYFPPTTLCGCHNCKGQSLAEGT